MKGMKFLITQIWFGYSGTIDSQGILGRCPPLILFGLKYVVVLKELSDTYFFYVPKMVLSW